MDQANQLSEWLEDFCMILGVNPEDLGAPAGTQAEQGRLDRLEEVEDLVRDILHGLIGLEVPLT